MRAQPDQELKIPCEDPVNLNPFSTLGDTEVEPLWGKDRAALTECGLRHSKLLDFFTKRDAALANVR